ncbi:MAG TPA: hypothetical protein VF200_10495 [Woeseiaceae bacterium]
MSAQPAPVIAATVVTFAELDRRQVEAVVEAYGARLVQVGLREPIPGSYWGDAEAGLIGNSVYVRGDTPAHSLLHELCHYVCMDDARRAALATDAGGDDDEEGAVCYLQVLLAERLAGFGADRCLADMDAWGYSFREGSARAWLDGDGRFARDWLRKHGLVDAEQRPTLRLR